MPNIFFGKPKGEMMEFDDHETEHLKVVRVREGESLEVTDGKGIMYKVIVRKIGKKRSYGDIIEAHRVEKAPEVSLSLYVASSNWERLRWLVEKAVELGADRIVVFRSERSKRDYAKKRKKIELVVRDAAKQCRRFLFPKVELHSSVDLLNFDEKEILLLDRFGEDLRKSEIGVEEGVALIVGPEGGFTEEEKTKLSGKARVVSLGDKVLRFETAGLAALVLFAFRMGKI